MDSTQGGIMFEVTEKANAKIRDFLKKNNRPFAIKILFQAC
jgi:hypothetical protein